MNEIIKVCKKHGDLGIQGIRFEKFRSNGKEYIRKRCAECRRDLDRIHRLNNKIKHIAEVNAWKKKNRSKVNEWARQDRKNNPDKYRKWAKNHREKYGNLRNEKEILRRRGITKEQYLAMVKNQENRCKICGKEETRKSRTKGNICKLAIDHCHETGIVRGLLCHACNVGIGAFRDSIDLLKKTIEYLNEHICAKTNFNNPDG